MTEESKFAQKFIDGMYNIVLSYPGQSDLPQLDLPQTLDEVGDVYEYNHLATSKEYFEMFMASNPYSEIKAFYKLLDDRDKEKIKTFEFTRTKWIIEKIKEFVYAKQHPKNLPNPKEWSNIPESGPEEKELLDDGFCLSLALVEALYYEEPIMITGMMQEMMKRIEFVKSRIDTLSEDKLNEHQVCILIDIEVLEDEYRFSPRTLLKSALSACEMDREKIEKIASYG